VGADSWGLRDVRGGESVAGRVEERVGPVGSCRRGERSWARACSVLAGGMSGRSCTTYMSQQTRNFR